MRCALSGLLLLAGCSLLKLDDLDLDACASDRDCDVLRHVGTGDLTGCYHCNQGRCERSGELALEAVARAPDLRWLNASPVASDTTLLTWGGADAVRGLQLKAAVKGPPADGQPVSHADNCGAFGFGALDPESLIGLCVEQLGCEAGRLKVGLSRSDAPFSWDPARVLIEPAVQRENEQCPRAGGVRSVAVATHTVDERVHGMAVWLAATASQARAAASVCEDASTAQLVSATLEESADGRFLWGHSFASSEADLRSFASVPPRLVAAEHGYLLAYATSDGVRLRTWPMAGLASQPGPSLTLRAAQADRIGLTLGAGRAGQRSVLVTWTSGCGAAMKLSATTLRWTVSGLAQVEDDAVKQPFTLRADREIVAGPVAAYAERGFRRQAPLGGFAVAWIERAGSDSVLVTSHVPEVDLQPTAAEEVGRRAGLDFPFLHTPDASRFAYGGASDDQLYVYNCQ